MTSVINSLNVLMKWKKEASKGNKRQGFKCAMYIVSLTLLVALMLKLLTACSTVYVPAKIEGRLTSKVPEPELIGDTWRDVGVYSLECKAALEQCNDKLEAIKETTKE